MLLHTARTELSPLAGWMQQSPPVGKALPLCHTTDGYTLKKIIRSAELFAPEPCKMFGEFLLYLFYGRPAYRKLCTTSIVTTARAPVVILLSSAVLEWCKRMYPFDSAAFLLGRYGRWMHEAMKLRDFDITHLPDAARRFVASFYTGNLDYFLIRPRRPTVPCDDCYEAEALAAMLNDTDASSADDRRLAIEIQVGQPVPFEYPFVRGLILPRELQATANLTNFLKGPGCGVDVRYYDLSPLKPSTEYQALLEAHALQMATDWGLL